MILLVNRVARSAERVAVRSCCGLDPAGQQGIEDGLRVEALTAPVRGAGVAVDPQPGLAVHLDQLLGVAWQRGPDGGDRPAARAATLPSTGKAPDEVTVIVDHRMMQGTLCRCSDYADVGMKSLVAGLSVAVGRH